MTQPLPSWAGDGKRFVPAHLNSGMTRSSFETGEEVPSSFRRQSVSGQPATLGSSFGAPKTLRKPADADLPPSESIHINRTKDLSEISFKSETKPQTTTLPRDSALPGTAILVFGFPAGMAMSVVQHFSQFGVILENTSGTSGTSSGPNTSASHPPAIECGRNWLRLRYRDRAAAERAVGENGRMLPGEFVVGAVLADGGDGVPAPSAFNSLLVDDSDTSLLADVSSILGSASFGPKSTANGSEAATGSVLGNTSFAKPASSTGSATLNAARPDSGSAPGSNGSATSTSTDTSKLVVKTPATSLFKHQEKHIVPHPHLHIQAPESLKKELSWLSWGTKKLRETVFGWDDL